MDNYTKFLMHFDESPLKDELNSTITNSGVSLDTSIKKFNNGSGYFNGGSHISIQSNNNDLNFGTNDFTIECWFNLKPSQVVGYPYLIGDNSNTGILLKDTYVGNKISFAYYDSGHHTRVLTSLNAISDTNWHHIALVRNLGIFYLFIDGTLNSTNENYKTAIMNFTTSAIGYSIYSPSNTCLYGNVDELRISNIARWTSNFNVPTTGYYDYFLIQDGNDIFNTNGNNFNKIGSTPYSVNMFQNNGMNKLNNINSTVINMINNNKYKISLYKGKN